MAEKELSLEQLVEEFEYHKRQYEDMEAVSVFSMFISCH